MSNINEEIYEKLANALDALPNGFPRTPSNVEIPMLKKIFSEDEARLACKLGQTPESVEEIAQRINGPVEETKTRLKAMLENAVSFEVRDCVCRKQQDLNGTRRCDFPLRNCVNFTTFQRKPTADTISKEKALAILDECEQIGLVHTVSNIIKGMYYVCNCCGCCCGILRGINDWGIEESVAHANYYAEIKEDDCTECGICVERCQVNAIKGENGMPVVNREKCIGCGLCVTGCPNQAVQLHKKPDAELVHPPEDFAAWERIRLQSREKTSKHVQSNFRTRK